jgi:hypothetical protein
VKNLNPHQLAVSIVSVSQSSCMGLIVNNISPPT